MNFLKNYKTYLCALGIGIITALHAAGMLTDSMFVTLSGFFGAGGMAALRHAIGRK